MFNLVKFFTRKINYASLLTFVNKGSLVCICLLQDFLKELEMLSRVFLSEHHIEEPRTNPCEPTRQSLGTVTAQS